MQKWGQGLIGMVAAMLLMGAGAAAAQPAQAPRPEVTAALARFDGVWIGPARMTLPDGSVNTFEQMERIGPMLGGEIRVMEGKARGSDGATLFNAFTVFSEAAGGGIEMRSHVWGDELARVIELTPEGYNWRMETSGGPITYVITVRDGVWHETGTITLANGTRAQFFEMTLTRRGDTDWPAANPAFLTTD
ncbi:DUF1579 domain-containing protein [Brevundimonas sp. R86498]|uniref:DUF1579 domain-containing protein n=1 Tax=Brevundimonas sp. R86498 TaxID=3093845 RepID=UPI0037C83944